MLFKFTIAVILAAIAIILILILGELEGIKLALMSVIGKMK